MRFKYALFDLDGTLTDSKEGVINSVRYALTRMGITPPDPESLLCYIGPPLSVSFNRDYGFDDAQCETAVGHYQDNYARQGIRENAVYDGIVEVLETLKAAGVRLGVATSKPEYFAKQVIDQFDLTRYFEVISGCDKEDGRQDKAAVILSALERLGIKDRSKVVMIGDRKYDVEAAKQLGLASIGVLHGYGGKQEFLAAGADMIAPDVKSIVKLVLGQ